MPAEFKTLFCTQCGREIGRIKVCSECGADNEFLDEEVPTHVFRMGLGPKAKDMWGSTPWRGWDQEAWKGASPPEEEKPPAGPEVTGDSFEAQSYPWSMPIGAPAETLESTPLLVSQDSMKSEDSKDSKGSEGSKDSEDSKDSKDSKDAKDSKDSTATASPPAPPAEDGGTLILKTEDPVDSEEQGTFFLEDREERPVLGRLIRQSPPDLDRVYALYSGTMTIGTLDAEIQLERQRDRAVSRKHAQIEVQPKEGRHVFTLSDSGSANGTFLNGRRIRDPVSLANGDLVKFGDVEFRFQKMT